MLNYPHLTPKFWFKLQFLCFSKSIYWPRSRNQPWLITLYSCLQTEPHQEESQERCQAHAACEFSINLNLNLLDGFGQLSLVTNHMSSPLFCFPRTGEQMEKISCKRQMTANRQQNAMCIFHFFHTSHYLCDVNLTWTGRVWNINRHDHTPRTRDYFVDGTDVGMFLDIFCASLKL